MIKTATFVALFCAISTAKDEQKWVWNDNNRDGKTASRDASARYQVYEGDGPLRPHYQQGPLLYNENSNYGNRPGIRPDFIPNERPGGVYGSIENTPDGHYGGNFGHHPQESTASGILTGPVPSWVREGPFKNYDKCKCTEKFNCNSPGISYGHCDTGKQYCCYATKKIDQIGGPLPSRPVHSIDNGILVGPGGPVDGPRPNGIPHRRPIGSIGGGGYPRPGGAYPTPGGGYPRPGNGYPRPGGGGFGLGGGGRPDSFRPAGGNVHSIDNGILVGPGGPYDGPYRDRPGAYGNYRSAKN